MPLTDEQAKQIKAQLLQQIAKLPQNQQGQLRQYISAMSPQQLEQFLIKNGMLKPGQDLSSEAQESESKSSPSKSQPKQKMSDCIYCNLANKLIQSFALYEDKDYLAVLEINPFSQGHTIIIPKKHVKETKSLKSKAFAVANRLGKHIVKKLKGLKAESFTLTTSADLKHAIINIIPLYKNQPLNEERKALSPKELQELAIKIGSIEKRKSPKANSSSAQKQRQNQNSKSLPLNQAKVQSAIIKFNRRIP